MSTIKTTLIVDNGQFGQTLKESKKQVESFKSGISTAGASLVKFAGFLGAGVTAYEVFNNMMNSSQAISDAYGASIQSAKEATSSFFYSLSNGDWTPFLNGLQNTITLAKEAYAAMDQLGNTKMSYSYFDAKNQASLQDAMTILKDKNATEDQKKAAKEIAEKALKDQKEITEQFSRRSQEAMSKLVQSSTGLKDLDVSQMDLEKAFKLDVSFLGDDEKKALASKYADFTRYSEELRQQYTKTSQTIVGDQMISAKHFDQKGFNEALKPMLSQYQDAIIFNSTLNKESDEWLQNLMSIGQAAFNANRSLSSMEKSYNRASQSESGRGVNVISNPKEVEKPLEGSIGLLKSKIATLSDDYAKATNDGMRIGIGKAIKELQLQVERMEFIASVDLTPKKKATKSAAEFKEELANMKIGDDVIASAYRYAQAQEALNKGTETTRENFIATNEPIDNLGIGLQGASDMAETFGGKAGEMAGSAMQIISQLIVAKQGEAIASGIASAFSLPFPANIAAAAGVIGTIGSLFASIPKFESGGFVPGFSTTGDKVLARVNSGELILNRAQQSNLAGHLMNNQSQTLDVNVGGNFKLSGRDLIAAINKQTRFDNRTR